MFDWLNKLSIITLSCIILTSSLLGCSKKETQHNQPSSESSDTQSLMSRGKQIFVEEGCGNCHAIGGSGGLAGKALKAPDLADAAKRMDRETIKNSILNPEDGSSMPAFNGVDEDVIALITYLQSL